MTGNVADALALHAKVRPDHPAVLDGEQVVSYADFLARTNRMAAVLRSQGIGPGDRVAVMLPDSADHLILLFALARIGAVMMSFGPQADVAGRERTLATLELTVVVTGSSDAAFAGLRLLPFDQLTPAAGTGGDAPDLSGLPAVGGQALLLCSQSSGTTGTPKSIFWNHAHFLGWVEAFSAYCHWNPEDRYFTLIGLAFEFGRGFAMGVLQVGATVVINRSKALADQVAEMQDQRVTMSLVTPGHLRGLLNKGVPQPPLLPDMRALFTSTAAISPQEHREVRRLVTPNLYQSYGTNEVGTISFATPEDLERYPDSVGRLLPHIEAEIVNDAGRPLPFGELGRIRMRGPAFPTGYHDNPEATAERFRDGWFYPGDLAALNAEGYVFLKGREDDVINNEGAKFYPIEVESVLLSHPAVVEVACLPWPHRRVGEVAIACVRLKDKVSEDDLRAFCKTRLSSFKCPARVFFFSELPKGPTGKILKRTLKDWINAHREENPSDD